MHKITKRKAVSKTTRFEVFKRDGFDGICWRKVKESS